MIVTPLHDPVSEWRLTWYDNADRFKETYREGGIMKKYSPDDLTKDEAENGVHFFYTYPLDRCFY